MSKRLLRKLLNKNSDKNSDKISDKTQTDDHTQNLKYAQYYSTDKSRNVITKIPSKMSIKYNHTPIYSDNLSDVDSKLLTRMNNKDSKQVTYYSTDKEQYTTASIPHKVHVINNLSDLSTDAIIDIYDDDESQDDEDESQDDEDESQDDDDEFESLYSNTFLYNNDDRGDSYISELSSLYSQDLSNKSSYNSDSDTSYDTFYDDSVKKRDDGIEDLLDLYSVKQKDDYFDTRVKKYDLEGLLDL